MSSLSILLGTRLRRFSIAAFVYALYLNEKIYFPHKNSPFDLPIELTRADFFENQFYSTQLNFI